MTSPSVLRVLVCDEPYCEMLRVPGHVLFGRSFQTGPGLTKSRVQAERRKPRILSTLESRT